MGPLVRIEPQGWLYVKVSPDDCEEILEKTILQGEVIDRLIYHKNGQTCYRQDDIPFYKKQTRYILEHCGRIDADSIEEYIALDGYTALEKVLFEMTPDEVISQIKLSNLRGRGGAGFPTGVKWETVCKLESDKKYIICNGDEGDPGAFMDRSIMEGNPHQMLEGMMIAAASVGADEGYIYVRAEYPMVVARLQTAIRQAREVGLLGENILGSGFNFNIHINQGAGAFVCGEETALINSIEGARGMPRVRPPLTVVKGLFGKPTVPNNVETYANVPMILNRGAEWYRDLGTATSGGTKVFALTGNIENTGLIEIPMGTTLREVIYDIGGGCRNDKEFKAVQIGGPSGGCLTKRELDLPLDYDSLKSVGAMIGSGVIFGVTGGVTEAVLRRLVEDKSKTSLSYLAYHGVRGLEGVKETVLPYGDRELKIAVVSGLGNAKNLIEKIKAGAHYDFVEVMACPNGCINGGGQPFVAQKAKEKRGQGLYAADKLCSIKRSEENPLVQSLYEGLLKDRTHELLHVHYQK